MTTGVRTDRNMKPTTIHDPSPFEKACQAVYLGMLKYNTALELQKTAVQAVTEGRISGIILLMQHPPVLTIGQFHGDNQILISPEILEQRGIAVHNTNRGGSVTAHEPGQLVGYPIINLKTNALGVRDYVWKLEEVIVRVLGKFGIVSNRIQEYPGVWVGDEKVCSVGIHVYHSVTMHGFALNVNNDLRIFECINPCGIRGVSMTSMSRLLGYDVTMESVIKETVASFSSVFGWHCQRSFARCNSILDVLNG